MGGLFSVGFLRVAKAERLFCIGKEGRIRFLSTATSGRGLSGCMPSPLLTGDTTMLSLELSPKKSFVAINPKKAPSTILRTSKELDGVDMA